MKVKYKEQEINIPEGATIEVVNGDLVITPKDVFTPKNGDICYFNNGACERILIYKNNIYGGSMQSYAKCEMNGSCLCFNRTTDQKCVRMANEQEKQTLFNALEEAGKRWNSETKQIENMLKVGDICIFWNNDKKEAIMSEICDTRRNGYLTNDKSWYENAIKCDSLEQYKEFIKQ